MSLSDAKESLSRYYDSVLNCLDLEGVDLENHFQDNHYKTWASSIVGFIEQILMHGTIN